MSARCTVWIRVKTEHAERARAIWAEQDWTPYEEDESDEGYTEFAFEEVRDPDDLSELLSIGGIPYRLGTDDGQGCPYLEIKYCGRMAYIETRDGDISLPFDRETDNADAEALESARKFVALEREFEEYLKS